MRSPFSLAIHRSIQRRVRKWEHSHKIKDQKVESKVDAIHLSAQLAYQNVRTEPGPNDKGHK